MVDYQTVFLEKADLLKYRLYGLLARPYVKDVTITDLAAMWENKYQPTYNVFQEVLADVAELTGLPRQEVRAAMLAATDLPLSLDKYRAYLVKQGMVYHLLDYVLRANSPSLAQFCDNDFVSRSTVTRKLRPLNQLIAPYHVKLKLAKMNFSGAESSIRYVLYSIYWWTFRGSEWPFAPMTPAALHAECDQIGIFNDRPITQTQMQYFLAISHLRLGKGCKLKANAVLTAFDHRVSDFGLRSGVPKPPFSRLDTSLYNFFQISQPRFDAKGRASTEPPIEMALLATPETLQVADALSAALYRPECGDIDTDLYVNLLRLAFGYQVCGGDFPQAEDVVASATQPLNQALGAEMAAALEGLPETKALAVYRDNAAHLGEEVARLGESYRMNEGRTDQLQVAVDVDLTVEGAQSLVGFVNSVPWIARVVPGGADLMIETDQLPITTEPTFAWYANALDIDVYRESLITQLVERNREKRHA